MQNREGRSHAGPPSTRDRGRADVARPGLPQPPDGALDTLELPEALIASDLFDVLPAAARRDLLAAPLGGNAGGTL